MFDKKFRGEPVFLTIQGNFMCATEEETRSTFAFLSRIGIHSFARQREDVKEEVDEADAEKPSIADLTSIINGNIMIDFVVLPPIFARLIEVNYFELHCDGRYELSISEINADGVTFYLWHDENGDDAVFVPHHNIVSFHSLSQKRLARLKVRDYTGIQRRPA